jgi:hypothetical protein
MKDAGATAAGIRSATDDIAVGERALVRAREFSRERMARETVEVYRNVQEKPAAG